MSYCLIVEDHPRASQWLAEAARAAFADIPVQRTETIAAARSCIKATTPRYALVDLGLPDGNGLDIIQDLHALRTSAETEITVVVSTVMNDDNSLFNAIRSGADGYVLKEEPQATLIEMLQGISAGKPPLSASVARRLLAHFHEQQQPGAKLTARETEVLQLIAKGFTAKHVAEMLGLTTNTAAGYVKTIYRKLNISSRAEATLEASRRGLV